MEIVWTFFSLVYRNTAQYRLKYCLKESLNQPTIRIRSSRGLTLIPLEVLLEQNCLVFGLLKMCNGSMIHKTILKEMYFTYLQTSSNSLYSGILFWGNTNIISLKYQICN